MIATRRSASCHFLARRKLTSAASRPRRCSSTRATGTVARRFASLQGREQAPVRSPRKSLPLGHCREGGCDLLERLALSCDGVTGGDEGGGEHADGSENIAAEDALPRTAFDQLAENKRRGDAPEAGPDGVEDRNGERANFEREGLANREIRRACCGRGDEKHDHPADGLGGGRKQIPLKGGADGDQKHAGERIGH